MARKLPKRLVPQKSGRPAYVWAGCGSGSGSGAGGRVMAKQIGTLAGRPAYITAECRQVAGSGSGPHTVGRFLAKRIGSKDGRPAYVRVCCPRSDAIFTGCCPDLGLPATLFATVVVTVGGTQTISFPMTYRRIGTADWWYGHATTAVVCGGFAPYVNVWLECLPTVSGGQWWAGAACYSDTADHFNTTPTLYQQFSTQCPDPFARTLSFVQEGCVSFPPCSWTVTVTV